MQLHSIQRTTPRETVKRIGRGGKRGKTSGKGGKGQTARAGARPRPEMRDIIKRLPKLRGFGKNRARTVNSERDLPQVVNLNRIETVYEAGSTVSPGTLLQKGLISKQGGKVGAVKVLGTGTLTKAVTVSGCLVSKSVEEKVKQAGGSVIR